MIVHLKLLRVYNVLDHYDNYKKENPMSGVDFGPIVPKTQTNQKQISQRKTPLKESPFSQVTCSGILYNLFSTFTEVLI